MARKLVYRAVRRQELESAVKLATNCYLRDKGPDRKRVYSYGDAQLGEYVRCTLEGVFGKANTRMMGAFDGRKLVGTGFYTGFNTILSTVKRKRRQAQFGKALAATGFPAGRLGYVGVLVVAPEYRRQGTGSELFNALLSSRNPKHDAVIGYHVPGAKSEGLLEKCGFRQLFKTRSNPSWRWVALFSDRGKRGPPSP
jgi:GNAT superfamily N-acetyltransferase